MYMYMYMYMYIPEYDPLKPKNCEKMYVMSQGLPRLLGAEVIVGWIVGRSGVLGI